MSKNGRKIRKMVVLGTIVLLCAGLLPPTSLASNGGGTLDAMLIKNINPGASDSNPSGFTVMDGTLYFNANDGTTGAELWKSDGTTIGTVLVKDIYPGAGDSNPMDLTVMDSTLYFRADNGTTGWEMWKSDGTTGGTTLVKDINPGTSDAHPQGFTVMGSTLYFLANDGTTGYELWKSDGTTIGTVLVKDIYPGAGDSNPTDLTVMGSTLYFRADNGTNGTELWKSDGTAIGTTLVKDIYPGASGSSPAYLTLMDGTLYFRAVEITNGVELWKSDGTTIGTVLVKDIYPGASHSSPVYLTVMDGTLYFQAIDSTNGQELWKSDGTTGGTTLVKDINPGVSHSSPAYLTVMDGTLYFKATDGTTGFELWKSDGTTIGTTQVKDIRPGASGSSPAYLTVMSSTLYFRATDSTNGVELWRTYPVDGWDSWTHPHDMTSLCDGNVGIGTTTPSDKLHVNGSFRVESNPEAYLFFVDAANDMIGIGTNSPSFGLDIHGKDIRIYNPTSYSSLRVDIKGIQGRLGSDLGGFFFACDTNGKDVKLLVTQGGVLTHALRLMGNSNGAVFNEGGSDRDFRVESTGNSHMLFVDASADAVGIGTSSPESTFHIYNGTGSGGGTYSSTVDAIIEDDGQAFLEFNGNYFAGVTFNDDGESLRAAMVFDYSQDSIMFVTGNVSDRMTITENGNVGIGTNTPQRALHINDVMRLEPRSTAPGSPSMGDLYMDSDDGVLNVYDGDEWRDCYTGNNP